MPHRPSRHEVETFSGGFVNTSDPSADSIVLEDIAHALSQTCRYGGHSARFYSVAEHAVLVSRRLEDLGFDRRCCLAGLHHDDSEAYLGDIPRPLKPLLGTKYTELTYRMDAAVCEGLGLPIRPVLFDLDTVKRADNWALFVEARNLLPSRGINWAGSFEDWDIGKHAHIDSLGPDPSYWRGGLDPTTAEGEFLSRHHELI